MKKFKSLFAIIVLSACASQTATPLGNDMAQIDVSAAPVYGRAGAQRMAMEKAAQTTIDYGYDRFMVLGNKAWTELQGGGGSYGQFNAMGNQANGNFGSGWSINRAPETTMVIKMYHNKDKGASKAVDARQFLPKQ